MKRHWAYLKYVMRHKYWVAHYCAYIGVPFWRAWLHDWSKFLPSEWLPYARTFYKPDGTGQYEPSSDFEIAWRHHQRRQPHHWQYWLLTWDRGETVALRMPDVFVREMVADWCGAGRAIRGKLEVWDWFENNQDKMILHHSTRLKVVRLLEELKNDCRVSDMLGMGLSR